MPDNSHIIPVPGVKNFRDMGGYRARDGRTLRKGRLFRSGHLSETGEGGGEILHNLNIGTVIDFRSEREKERNPVHFASPWAPDYCPTPIGGNAAAWVRDLYDRLSTSDFPAKELRDQFILAFETIPVANADGLKRFFDILHDSPSDQAVLFHCTAGKDRTGIAGALLMQALDIDPGQIMVDFLMTNEAVDLEGTSREIAEKMSERAGRPIDAAAVHPLVGVEEAFLHAAFASIDREFGSLERYLAGTLGLTPDRQDRLKHLFLEG